MAEDIVLKSGWLKLDSKELDKLRNQMRREYEGLGGTKKFNSHLPNYEELRQLINHKLQRIMKNGEIEISIQGQQFYEIVPGNTFFRDLFYSKRKTKNAQFQEYNIDICYLFAYGLTRFEYMRSGPSKRKTDISDDKYKIIISSTLNNMTEAEKVKSHLAENFDFIIETETRNSQAYNKGSLSDLYSNLNTHTLIFPIISRDYLQNENCIKELIEFTNTNLDLYLRHTFHIILKDVYSGDFNIYDSLGRSELLKYWKLRIEKLEENHKILMSGKKDKSFYKKLKKEFDEIKEIIEELHKVLGLIRENPNGAFYEIFLEKINSLEEFKKILPKPKRIHLENIELETTYKRIKIPSTNNPKKPEFPPKPFYEPDFPASDTFRIDVPGFKNVWMKDESTNPTGTHKDRLAWEVVIKYKSLIEALKYKDVKSLPQMSIISSGSAAIAIQNLFNLYKIPTKLKVLADLNLSQHLKEEMSAIGCELYETDLSEKLLNSEEIKELTDNKNGIDITYREVLDPTHDNYYDWMSYEILREQPKWCFVPFGTGDLFINILNIVKIEYFNSFVQKHDPRFFGNVNNLRKCHYLGASSDEPDTRLDKLFSNYLPSIESFKKYIGELKSDYRCVGEKTGIYYVEEDYVDIAIDIATKQEIDFEPSGLAGLALLLQMKDIIPPKDKILIVNTGKTKKVSELMEKYDER